MSFSLQNAASGALGGFGIAGPWGALAGGVLGGFFGPQKKRVRPTAGPAPTSFRNVADRSAGSQSAYNAPDPQMAAGAPALRPMAPTRGMAPRQATIPQLPQQPVQTGAFQNSAATLGLANPTYYSQPKAPMRPIPMARFSMRG